MAIQGDAIVNRILSDATIKAEEIINVAKSKAEEIVLNAVSFSKQKQKEAEKISKLNQQKIEEKYKTLSRIEGNKILLNAKQEVLRDLKIKALDFLLNQEKSEMLNFIEDLLKKHASKDEVMLFNVKNISLKDINSINIVKKLGLKVKENDNSEEIGIILCSDNCDKNLLFDVLIENAFNESQEEIYKSVL